MAGFAKNFRLDYKSYFKETLRAMTSAERKRIKAATNAVKQQILDNLKSAGNEVSREGQFPGTVTGDLRRGVAVSVTGDGLDGYVGFRHPAQHAHLLEFGRRERSGLGGRQVTHMGPRPFFVPAFTSSREKVKEILSMPLSEFS